MTVSSIVPVNTYTGNSTVKKFDFDFLIENENELIVQHISEDNVITTLTLGVDYSINEIGNQNGSYIIFPLENSSYNILKENEKITLMLTLTIKQESEFKNSSYFNLNILEWTFDYIVRILQILSRKIERCIKVGEGLSSSPDEVLTELNESKRIAINAAESALESKNISEENKNECIEYLEEYNQKVLDFNNEYNECLQSIIDKGIDTRCDLDLSNLSETGEKHFINKTQITNCILEIPQDIKLELTDGVLKIKSGSKVYIPNGVGNFDVETISSDVIVDLASSSGTFRVFYRKGGNVAYANQGNVKSGPTPTNAISGMYYDTTLNKVGYYRNNTTGDGSLYTFPLAEVTITNGKCTSINQIFNGIGYIGSTIFLLPNLKVLLCDGRNADGTLKNYELNISKCLTYTTAVTLNNGYFVIGTNDGITIGHGISPKYETDIPNTSLGTFTYNRADNYIYTTSQTTTISKRAFIARISVSGGVITSFKAFYPFFAMDYNIFLDNGISNVICKTAPNTISTASSQRPAVVVENYVNGTSGYRVYSDGYCEQWGETEQLASSTSITITLLKSFINKNYYANSTMTTNGTAKINRITNRTTTQFTIAKDTLGGGDPLTTNLWEAKGYIK